MGNIRICVVVGVFGLVLVPSVCIAQADVQRGFEITDDERPQPAIRETPLPSAEPIDLASGVTDDLLAPYRAHTVLRSVRVEEIDVIGNTVLSEALVTDLIAEYRGVQLSFEEIQSLQTRLTQAYVLQGYVNSGVTIPEQEIVDGRIVLQAHEGRLDAIRVDGNRALRPRYIETRIRAHIGEVLNIRELENALRLFRQNPLIEQVNAQVVPGVERGDSVLDLRIAEARPAVVSFAYDNYRSPSVGELEGVTGYNHQSLTGHGDTLGASYSVSDGQDDWYVRYGIPLSPKELQLDTYYSRGQSSIVEEPFTRIDIVSNVRTAGLRLSRPLVRGADRTGIVGLTVENSETDSFLLGLPFSFSAGEQAGRSETSVVRLSADWTWRRTTSAVALGGTLSRGVDWFDATENDGDLPDSDFTRYAIRVNYARRIGERGVELSLRSVFQFSDDPLLPVEKLAVGGVRTVRGYRENQLVRDEGAIASLEVRIPLLPDDAGRSRVGFALAPFVDFGTARDRLAVLASSTSQRIYSAGLGLLWNPRDWFSSEIYLAEDLEDVGNDGDSLQERGVHARFGFQWQF